MSVLLLIGLVYALKNEKNVAISTLASAQNIILPTGAKTMQQNLVLLFLFPNIMILFKTNLQNPDT
jgi:hypothetical protein